MSAAAPSSRAPLPEYTRLPTRHGELFAGMGVAGCDIGGQPLDPLLPFLDFGRQGADLQRMLCCWLRCAARNWSSLRISVSTFTFSMTAGLPEAMALISA